MSGNKKYLDKNVYEAALQRLRLIFDEFETIVVSYSGGKDSTVLLELARQEAQKRNRQIYALFIDLEGQYQATIEQVERQMLNDETIIPIWICLPLNLRNAVSVFQPHWACWDPEQKPYWIRALPEHDCVISDQDLYPFWRYRMEFEEFIVEFPKWMANGKKYASLVAIRADESLNRFKAVARRFGGPKKSAYYDREGNIVRWGTVLDEKHQNIVSLYPIYDWRVEDIWHFIGKEKVPYARIYDLMHLVGIPLSEQRICQPYGDDQRKGLDLWAVTEPETWSKVLDRVIGVNYGARYAGQKILGYHRGLGLPDGHTWKSYTFFLLSTLPEVMRERYLSNYAVFLEWWMRHGYPVMGEVHDDETPYLAESGRRKLPSWRRLALAILKNDFLCKSLSIGAVKDVYVDVYERVSNGEPVKVRKSVKPVYEYLREQYQAYLDNGVDAIDLDFKLPTNNPIIEKYKDL